MKTLIIGLLMAVGLVNSTETRNPKEMVSEIPMVPAMGEYVPIAYMYIPPRQPVKQTKAKGKKK